MSLLLALAIPCVQAQTNLITNPSFEDGTGTTCSTGSAGCTVDAGSCYLCTTTGNFLPGWQLTAGNLDRYKMGLDPNSDLYAGVPDGSWGIDMNGRDPATIQQNVNGLTTGIPYTLGVRLTNNMKGTFSNCTQDKPLQVNVYDANTTALIATKNFSTAGLSSITNTWGAGTLTFNNTAGSIIVELKSLFGDPSTVNTCGCCGIYTSFYGPAIDYITLVPGSVPLPVKLESFRVAKNGSSNKVEVLWTTASEQNTDHFELQYSAEGTDFATVAMIAASHPYGGGTYRYDYLQPASGKGFYRLKCTDRDGLFSYSSTAAVYIDAVKSMLITEGARKGSYILSGLQSGGQVAVFDMQGRAVIRNVATSAVQTIDLNDFSTGIYMLQIVNNGLVTSQKLVR